MLVPMIRAPTTCDAMATTAILPISPLTLAVPSRKMFIQQLHDLQESDGKKTCCIYGKETEISVVWLQGNLIEMNSTEDYLILDDGTGQMKVDSVTRVPGGCSVTSVGTYVMIIGDVTGPCDSVGIRALKVHDLSARAQDAKYWDVEVMDAQLNS